MAKIFDCAKLSVDFLSFYKLCSTVMGIAGLTCASFAILKKSVIVIFSVP